MDATFFALVALVIFLGIVIYLKVPGMITRNLDARSDQIRNDLEDARRLREEAQELLAEYQRKRKEAEQEASDIVAAAERDAELMAKEAEEKTAEFVARRTAQAEDKIAQAQAQAISDVRALAVDLAVAAAGKVIEGKVSGAAAEKMIKDSIAEVKARLN
ncbi:MAG: F0F1 ATP synthase subunit B, partial [Nitratireductor sp.]|nr:F0F1 ATP synthase subunit B [Nitratireductor sp.]